MFLPRPRLARERFPLMVGPIQRQALQLVARLNGMKEPKAGTITSRGKMRDHVFNDLVGSQYLTIKHTDEGNIYNLTARGRKALRDAVVSKAPPSGWHKVRDRRRSA